jgi:hypothetical protein
MSENKEEKQSDNTDDVALIFESNEKIENKSISMNDLIDLNEEGKEQEIWKTVLSMDGKYSNYEVSNLARVRAKGSGKIIKTKAREDQVPTIHFSCIDAETKKKYESNLSFPKVILEAFEVTKPFLDVDEKGKEEGKIAAFHLDGNNQNNELKNLVWKRFDEICQIKKRKIIDEKNKVKEESEPKKSKGPWCRAVICTDVQGNKQEFKSVTEAANSTNRSAGLMVDILNGRRKDHSGNTWHYAEERKPKENQLKIVDHDLPDEVWKRIPSHPDYDVSNYGRFKSRKADKDHGQLMKTQIDKQGYASINLEGTTCSAHVLVAKAFCSNPIDLVRMDLKFVVDHKDENKTNNHITNLHIVTQSVNVSNAIGKQYFLLDDNNQLIALYPSATQAIQHHPKFFDTHNLKPISDEIRDASIFHESVIELFKSNSFVDEYGVYRTKHPDELKSMGAREEIKDLPNEMWKRLDGFNGYFISQLGRIKSVNHEKHVGALMQPSKTTKGSKYIVKPRKNGTQRDLILVQIVAEHFLPKPTNHCELKAVPLDMDWSNANISNLRWVTKSAYQEYSYSKPYVVLDTQCENIVEYFPSQQTAKLAHKEWFNHSNETISYRLKRAAEISDAKVLEFKQKAIWTINGILTAPQ